MIRFNGTLADSRSSTQTVVFSLYDSAQAGAALWSETQEVEIDNQGNYTVTLGSTQAEGIPMSLLSSGKGQERRPGLQA